MGTVSVVIPAYNRQRTIQRAVQSVLSQTYENVEALVVDDHSSDATAAIVARLAEEDVRVRFLRRAVNGGAQAARNTGIRAATGAWVMFLDSDDELLPRSLETKLALALKQKASVVASSCYVRTAPESFEEWRGLRSVQGDVFKEVLKQPAYANDFLLEKAALYHIGLLDEKLAAFQEWDLSIRLARHFRFAVVEEPTFIWDQTGDDTISQNPARAAKGYLQVLRRHRWSILRHLGPRWLARHYTFTAQLYIEADDRASASRCALASMLLWPPQRQLASRGARYIARSVRR